MIIANLGESEQGAHYRWIERRGSFGGERLDFSLTGPSCSGRGQGCYVGRQKNANAASDKPSRACHPEPDEGSLRLERRPLQRDSPTWTTSLRSGRFVKLRMTYLVCRMQIMLAYFF